MFTQEKLNSSIAIVPLIAQEWHGFYAQLAKTAQQWVQLHNFTAQPEQVCIVPDSQGGIAQVLVGYDAEESTRWAIAGLPQQLPAGHYHLQANWLDAAEIQAYIGWGLGCYQFTEFRNETKPVKCQLYIPSAQCAQVDAFVEAVSLVRDLINRPANHMMPEHLAQAAQQLATEFGGEFQQVVGEALLQQNYPAVHAVGRASKHKPRLLKLTWGKAEHPHIALVGKGVCFDTGGLDIKPSQFMRLMKKDMGGAAHALGIARLIMQLQLPLQLSVWIPAVDNAIGGDAFRPGDILATRAGKHVEVDNTDAEGRLVLCDTLSAVAEHSPEVVLDFATLTGAARVALGTEIPVFFSNSRALSAKLQAASAESAELIWNLPLHKPYFEQLKSHSADFTNSGGSYGGAITAALFLNEFVPQNIQWAHFDVMAWNNRQRSGRPIGGEAMGLFAVHAYLQTFCHI